MAKISKCHPKLKHMGRGLCEKCYQANYRSKNKAKIKKFMRQWQKENTEKANAQKLAWALANPEIVKETKRKYVKKNLKLYRAQCAKRHAAKMKRTPKWADLKEIKNIYLNCPDGYEVDHIVPLQGTNVCGLHVSYNLQYLTKNENRAKGNRL